MKSVRMPRELKAAARLNDERQYAQALELVSRVDLQGFYRKRDGRAYAEAFAAAHKGLALNNLGRVAEALPHLHRAERDLVLPHERIQVLRTLAQIAVNDWRLQDGLKFSIEAAALIEAQPRLSEQYAKLLVGTLLDQAGCHGRLNQPEEAQATIDRALAAVRAAMLHADLTDARWEEALTVARAALLVGCRSPLTTARKMVDAEAVVASALSNLGRHEEALDTQLRLLEFGKTVAEMDRQPGLLADLLVDVAEALTICGRTDEAWRYVDSARDILQQHCDDGRHANTVKAAELGVRGMMLEAAGHRAAAVLAVEDCIDIGRRWLRPGEEPPRFLSRAIARRDRLAAA